VKIVVAFLTIGWNLAAFVAAFRTSGRASNSRLFRV
jgi:hypothetical protein